MNDKTKAATVSRAADDENVRKNYSTIRQRIKSALVLLTMRAHQSVDIIVLRLHNPHNCKTMRCRNEKISTHAGLHIPTG